MESAQLLVQALTLSLLRSLIDELRTHYKTELITQTLTVQEYIDLLLSKPVDLAPDFTCTFCSSQTNQGNNKKIQLRY